MVGSGLIDGALWRLRFGLITACVVGLLSGCALVERLAPRGGSAQGLAVEKREVRGAWLPTIFRSEYTDLTREEGRRVLGSRIALLHAMGCNVVVFQVRAEGDAWYPSRYEPWSRFFTGEQGRAPREDWDPLGFVIEECHRRGMELHAWLNPYRGASSSRVKLAPEHPARRYPGLFVRYGDQLMLDPGLPESRRYVTQVIEDIVSRYDVDAIHFDDYFYPYPIAGEAFPDDASFEQYGRTAGYTPTERDRWRRSNVNMLIYDVRQLLLRTKPWVRFGISPFGIYRNASSDPKGGSDTRGLQCYDDLYADVLHWANEGWIDYVAPQIYWNVGHDVADYETLTKWWGTHIRNPRVQLYIGQDVKRTMDARQLEQKLLLSRAWAQGNFYWPGDELVRNYGGVADTLRQTHHQTRALLPVQTSPLGKTKAPAPLSVVWEDTNEDGHILIWPNQRALSDPESALYYVVYAFPRGVRPSIRKSQYIVSISSEPMYRLPVVDRRTPYTLLVTTVNRFWQESKPYKIEVAL